MTLSASSPFPASFRFFRRLPGCWLPVVLAALSGATAATTLSPVVVSVTRDARSADRSTIPISVLTRADIEQAPAGQIQSLLATLPGISHSRAGGLGGQLVMRGMNSNDPRMVLVLDGDRFRGRNTLEYNLLDPSGIERIEVIRGPASALYGADAMNGVVNVITRRARGDASRDGFTLIPRLASLAYASAENLRAGRAELEGVGNGIDLLLGLGIRHAGDFRSPAGPIANSDFRTAEFTARAGYAPDAQQRWELSARLARVEAGRPGGIGGAPGLPWSEVRESPIRENHFRIGYQHHQAVPWADRIELSLYRRSLDTARTGTTRRAGNDRYARNHSFVIGPVVWGGKLLVGTPWTQGRSHWGMDFYHEAREGSELASWRGHGHAPPTSSTPRTRISRAASQLNAGLFFHHDQPLFSAHQLSLGARYDWIRTRTGSTPAPDEDARTRAAFAGRTAASDRALTASGGLILQPLSSLQVVGNLATAFRAPATFEKFGASRVGTRITEPNPALAPERSITAEAGLRLRWPPLQGNLTAFDSRYRQLIALADSGPQVRQRQNIARAGMRGLELDGIWQIQTPLSLRCNASRARGARHDTGQPLPHVPPLNGLLSLRHQSAGYSLEARLKWSLAKRRIDPARETRSAGYGIVSLYGGLELARVHPALKPFRLVLGIENLADKRYAHPATVADLRYPASPSNPLLEPGRSLVLNLVGTP